MNSEVSAENPMTENPLEKFIQAFIENAEGKNSLRAEAEEKGDRKRKGLIADALVISNKITELKATYRKSLFSPDLDSCSIKSMIMCKQQELAVNIEVQTEFFGTAVTF